MAGERIKLEVAPRERTGSREARRLRKQGLIPGILYGRGAEPHAISIPERDLRRALTGGSGMHTILDVVLDGGGPRRVDPGLQQVCPRKLVTSTAGGSPGRGDHGVGHDNPRRR
jgi:large subunit ribosomal protein L25